MRKRSILGICILLMAAVVMAGCSSERTAQLSEKAGELLKEVGLIQEEVPPAYDCVQGEMDCVPQDKPDGSGYYVWHDGKYYPCVWGGWTDEKKFSTDYYSGTEADNPVYVSFGVYSDNPRLNHYSTLVPDALGSIADEPKEDESKEDGSGHVPDDGSSGDKTAISALSTLYYRLLPQEEPVTLEEGSIIWEVFTDGSGTSCIVQAGIGASAQNIKGIREAGGSSPVYRYTYTAQEECTVTEPVYLSLVVPDKVVPQIQIADGLLMEEITDPQELLPLLEQGEPTRRE